MHAGRGNAAPRGRRGREEADDERKAAEALGGTAGEKCHHRRYKTSPCGGVLALFTVVGCGGRTRPQHTRSSRSASAVEIDRTRVEGVPPTSPTYRNPRFRLMAVNPLSIRIICDVAASIRTGHAQDQSPASATARYMNCSSTVVRKVGIYDKEPVAVIRKH